MDTHEPVEPNFDQDFEELLRSDTSSRAAAIDLSSGSKQITATVVALSNEAVYLDIGYKTEGVLPLTAFAADEAAVQAGDKVRVTVRGRDADGYYELTRQRGAAVPKDYTSLEEAYEAKGTVTGMVTGTVKGGLIVDIGMRAFLPSSRSGTRDAAEMERLVGQTIRVRITTLDLEGGETGRPDAVVDRRSVVEEEAKASAEARFSELAEGDVVRGTVRSLTSFGAFVDLAGADALLHISDMAWYRVNDAVSIVSVGDEVDVKILKIDSADPAKRRIAVGLKQLQAHPWESVGEQFQLGQKVRGVVTRETDFGAFVEVAPGVEGLIHISELAWGKKVRKPSDVVNVGDQVEAVILSIDTAAKRMGLGLKQALGDPFAEIVKTIHSGAVIEGPVSQITKFGAFVTVTEGVEGLIHISEITAEKRLNHPSDALRIGQVVKAQVLEIDVEKRQLRLSMKQLVPTGLDEFLLEHAAGDTVSGRVIEIDDLSLTAKVELGEGIVLWAAIPPAKPLASLSAAPSGGGPVDLSQLGSLLSAKWKTADAKAKPVVKPEAEGTGVLAPGQLRRFRITELDAGSKKLAVELA